MMATRRGAMRAFGAAGVSLAFGRRPRKVAETKTETMDPDPSEGHAGVQAAIDDAHDAGGGVVQLQPGTYTGAGEITLRQGVSLWGYGNPFSSDSRAVSVLKLADGANADILTGEGKELGAEVRGVAFDGNKAENDYGGAIIPHDDGMSRLSVYSCAFVHTNGPAIDTTKGKIEEIVSNWVASTVGHPQLNLDHGDMLLAWNQIGSKTSRTVNLNTVSNSIIANNFIFMSGDQGIFIARGSEKNVISGNRINHSARQGITNQGAYNSFIGNQLYDNGRGQNGYPAIRHVGEDCTFLGNVASDTGKGWQQYGANPSGERTSWVGNNFAGCATGGWSTDPSESSVAVANIPMV